MALPEGVDPVWVFFASCHKEDHKSHEENDTGKDTKPDSAGGPAIDVAGAVPSVIEEGFPGV